MTCTDVLQTLDFEKRLLVLTERKPPNPGYQAKILMVFGATHQLLADQKALDWYRLVLVADALTFRTRLATNSKDSHCKPLRSLRSHQH